MCRHGLNKMLAAISEHTKHSSTCREEGWGKCSGGKEGEESEEEKGKRQTSKSYNPLPLPTPKHCTKVISMATYLRSRDNWLLAQQTLLHTGGTAGAGHYVPTRDKESVSLVVRTHHALSQVGFLVLRVKDQRSKVTESSKLTHAQEEWKLVEGR